MRSTCLNPQSSPLGSSPASYGETGSFATSTAGGSNTTSKDRKTILAAVVIPAYRPGNVLIDIVEVLEKQDWVALVVVDDGSGPEYCQIFRTLAGISNVTVISNAINMGKGSALKAGINFILCSFPKIDGVVTVDADGQHHPEDVHKVLENFRGNPDALVLGVRDFVGNVPLRSRIGNRITRTILHAVLGHKLSDSQTGLRAIPKFLLPVLLRVPASGYEFELEMLIATKHLGVRLVEQPIRTIYEPGNPTSHFQPLRDSMRIYFVLLRFTFIGILTAILDNLVFFLLFFITANVLISLAGSRFLSVVFNYAAIKKAVFLSEQPHRVVLPRHLLLVAVNAMVVYGSMQFLWKTFHIGPFPAKPLIETALFVANFAIQRDFVFTKRPK